MLSTHNTPIDLSQLPSGPIPYTMKNDYMCKAVLQQNRKALTGLLSALLSIPPEEIIKIDILNPIELGKTYSDKDCILDLKIRLNNNRIINIELQVEDLGNWPERSLTYLCRAFDQTKRGRDYGEILPTIHISILDFHLPHLTPEFYSEFKLANIRNHEIYSDKFSLNVLNLKTLEDDSIVKEPVDLYEWALLFKSETWEDLKMLAKKNDFLTEAVLTLHEMTDDERIREQCEAREKYDWDMYAATEKGRKAGLQEGHKTGLQEGHKAGLQEGAQRTLISQICRKLQKGKLPEVIAEELEEDLNQVKQICEVAADFMPECNADEIYDALHGGAIS